MACSDVDMDIQDYENPDETDQRDLPTMQQHQASAMRPDSKEPLHDLLQKQPAVSGIRESKQPDALGILQMIFGLLSIGLGIGLSVTIDIGQSLTTLFRVFQLTGVCFFSAGLICNLLLIYPTLLTVSLAINCGCIVVAVVAVCLISVDLAHWNQETNKFLKLSQVLELCVLVLEVFLSAILCIWFFKEKRTKSK